MAVLPRGLRINFDAGANQRAQREREAARAAKTKAKSDLANQVRGRDLEQQRANISQQQADTTAGRLVHDIDTAAAEKASLSLISFTKKNATNLEIGALRTPDDIEFVKWLAADVDRKQKYNSKHGTSLGKTATEALEFAEQGKVGEAREIVRQMARVAAESGTDNPGYIDISGADRTKLGLGLTDEQQGKKSLIAKRDHDKRMAEATGARSTAAGGRAERRLVIDEAEEARKVTTAQGEEKAANLKTLGMRDNTRKQIKVGYKALSYLKSKEGDPVIGPLGYGKLLDAIPGTDAYEFAQLIMPLKSEEFLKNVQELRGMGQLSNIEGDKLQSLIVSLDQSNPAMMEDNIKTIIATLKAAEKRGDKGVWIGEDGTLYNRKNERVDDEYNVVKEKTRAELMAEYNKLKGA